MACFRNAKQVTAEIACANASFAPAFTIAGCASLSGPHSAAKDLGKDQQSWYYWVWKHEVYREKLPSNRAPKVSAVAKKASNASTSTSTSTATASTAKKATGTLLSWLVAPSVASEETPSSPSNTPVSPASSGYVWEYINT